MLQFKPGVLRYKNSALVLLLFLLISACSTSKQLYHPAKKMAAPVLQNDLLLLKNILEANHPGLYWYTPKDSINNYFNIAAASITDSLNEPQFKNRVAWVVSKIRCGHTAVRFSRSFSRFYSRRRGASFPVALKVWNDSSVVVGRANREDSVFKRGTIVTGINQYSNRQLLDSMFKLLSADGYADNFKQQLISFNYPFYYRNTFGLDSQYTIRYVDSLGNNKSAILRNYVPKVDTGKKDVDTQPRLTRKEIRKFNRLSKRNFLLDTARNTAIVNINTFSGGRLNSFYRQTFRRMRKDSITNLVLDLRENSGGSIMSSKRLIQYLVNKPFKIADTVVAVSRSIPYRSHIRPWLIYWLSMRFSTKKSTDGFHFRYFEKRRFKPKSRNHYKGNVYLVGGGFTFSASTLVIGALKDQKNVIFVGEETGGGSYGNNAVHLPEIILPGSKVRVVLPLFRMVIDKNLPKTGRGIIPDVEVPPSSSAIKNGVDAKLEKVRLMIEGKEQKP